LQAKRLAGSLIAISAISASVFLFNSHPVRSSDHQDSPTVVARPGADLTDVFLFPSPTNPKNVDLVMDVVPLIPAGMSNEYSFDPAVLYQFKIAHGPVGSAHQEDMVLQMTASGTGAKQKLSLFASSEPKPYGPRNVVADHPLGTFGFNTAGGTMLSYGIKAFAGPRADPFFFDLFQFFKILPDRYYKNPRTGDALGTSMPTFNGYPAGSTSGANGTGYRCSTAPSTNALTQIGGGFNELAVVIEVPRALLPRYGSSIVHLGHDESSYEEHLRRQGRVSTDRTVVAPCGEGIVRNVQRSLADESAESVFRRLSASGDRILYGPRGRTQQRHQQHGDERSLAERTHRGCLATRQGGLPRNRDEGCDRK